MANSPTLRQKFVAASIQKVRTLNPSVYIIHYMNDILLAYPSKRVLLKAFAYTTSFKILGISYTIFTYNKNLGD